MKQLTDQKINELAALSEPTDKELEEFMKWKYNSETRLYFYEGIGMGYTLSEVEEIIASKV